MYNIRRLPKNCTKLTLSSCTTLEDYQSNQEEAVTEIILHASKLSNHLPENKDIVIRSHSGDVDINILAISILDSKQKQIFIDLGKGTSRKGACLSEIKLTSLEKKCILGLHAFSGNDYISSCFRKSKLSCGKAMKSSNKFEILFRDEGTTNG